MPKYDFDGFTLIELLVVISIIGILIGLSIFGLQGARESARDATRKADLETLRSGLAMYKSDCDGYPASLGSSLTGTLGGNCLDTNVYISSTPVDPVSPVRQYSYVGCADFSKYLICSSLENVATSNVTSVTCTDGITINCGSCGDTACNYSVTSP